VDVPFDYIELLSATAKVTEASINGTAIVDQRPSVR
jgi:hypothetical protein